MRPIGKAVLQAILSFLAVALIAGGYLYQDYNDYRRNTETRLSFLLRENLISVDLLLEQRVQLAEAIALEQSGGTTTPAGPGIAWITPKNELMPSTCASGMSTADVQEALSTRNIYVGKGQTTDAAHLEIIAPVFFKSANGGLIGICLDVGRVIAWWRSMEWPAGAAIALIRDRREILVRQPFRTDLLNKDISKGPLIRSLDGSNQNTGKAEFEANLTDGVIRLVAWEASSASNIMLVAGFSLSNIKDAWFGEAVAFIIAASVVSVALSVFVFFMSMSQLKSRATLTLSEARMQAAAEAGGMGVWDFDINTGTLEWDDRMFEIYQLDRHKFSGAYDAWKSRVHPDDLEEAEHALASAIANKQHFDTTFRIVMPNGSFHSIKAEANLLPDEKGEMTRMVGVNYDISNEVLSRDELEIARVNAERANMAKTEFLAAMSHELRTPLNAICGFSEMIHREVFGTLGNEKYREYAEYLNTSAQHLVSLVNNVLDLSKIEAGEMSFEEEEIDIDATFKECAQLVHYRGNRNAKDILIEISDAFPTLHTDLRALRQILINLISNADKYTLEGGTISLIAEASNTGTPLIRIVDTGIGIPPGDLDRVLEPFGQSRRNVHVTHEGTGLGLSLSFKLMELQGGHLNISSLENVGTTIELVFPASAETQHEQPPKLEVVGL